MTKATKKTAPAKITGVPTEAAKAKARAKAKGPKPGSARSNQSEKYSAGELTKKSDKITQVKSLTPASAQKTVITTADQNIIVDNSKLTSDLLKLAAVGGSFKAVQEWLATHRPQARLAKGLDGRNAPHSVAAAAEGRKPVTATKPAAAKLSRKGDFAYKVGKANDTRADTWTHYMVEVIQKHSDTASARAAHEKSGKFAGKKLDFNWSKAKGYIK